MIQLTKYKLKDVAKVEISGVDKKTKEGEVPVRLCNFTDVYYNWAITKKLESSFMRASANVTEISRFSLKKGQVAFTKDSETRDDIGISTYIADDFENVILGYHCALITPDESKALGKYINAFMHSSLIQKYFSHSAGGSGQRYSLSVEAMENMPLYLPSISEQERIASIFSHIDRKIELDHEINSNLEALARQLYDYWFVQFDFPDANGKPYKSSGGKMVYNEHLKREIPEGWNICRLENFVKANNTGDWGADEIADGLFEVGCIRGADILTLTDIPKRYIKSQSKLLSEHDIVIEASGGSPIQATGRSAYVTKGVIERNGGKITCSNFCHAFTLKDIHKAPFFYYSWRLLYDNDNMFNYEGKTSGLKNFMTEMFLKNYWIDIPDDLAINFFNKVSMWFAQIDNNIAEMASLTRQRDELLPLLMNGQVTVE